ncbi:dihydroxyacetone kinase [Colletotrichum truncatum]|uniref:Dihydroxyacetone kinase n=1 Tax=Colletotrichum truncatum TaxID=5467 RepID=A0ACC3YKB9_COLTU|nr:dihydroxyacetone kinase [Colletotrichum truncatum]KAF6784436.1 dihydroxyacetone kinase [Colletotrichum truncatum]
MSDRHIFPSSEGLVDKSLRGLVSYNPSLGLDTTNRVVFDTTYDRSKVSIISGGGSGHEPAWSGYVGNNMLSASVSGDIFASPSAKQILAGIEAVPSDVGTLLIITNYTGDCLHFGLAGEKARSRGHNCRIIICGDDVSVGKKKGSLVGRRGLAGQLGVLKITSGAAGAKAGSLDDIYQLGVAVESQIVSIAATLDHCHVPGRTEHARLETNELEIGTGPHNEPGYKKVNPSPSPQDLVDQLLQYCLKQDDPERSYVKFNNDDETILLVSNFGGISYLELGALVDEVLEQLEQKWNVRPVRIFAGPLETSLNAPAFSLSLINITAASKNCPFSVEQIKDFVDAKTNTHWESMAGSQASRRERKLQFIQSPPEEPKKIDSSNDVRMDPAILKSMLRAACTEVIDAEPDITKWDMVMGDGDCGETLRTGASHLLEALDKKGVANEGSIVSVLHELEEIVESKMGGTLGGILGIFFVSLSNSVKENASLAKSQDILSVWRLALTSALEKLSHYTPAKVGDRTVLDVLIPFVEGIRNGGFNQAVKSAIEGAEATRNAKAKLGRATYVGGGSENGGTPPDPGAWGAMVAIRGLQAGLA